MTPAGGRPFQEPLRRTADVNDGDGTSDRRELHFIVERS
jgi:hypothetical protein